VDPLPAIVEVEAPAVLAPPKEAGAARVSLRWSGVGALHQGYFSDREALTLLGSALGEQIGSRDIDVQIGWNAEDSLGAVILFLQAEDLPGVERGTGDASALVPLMKALARYRDMVAGRYDIRVLSFQVRVAVGDLCEVEAVGAYPPDGSEVSACKPPKVK